MGITKRMFEEIEDIREMLYHLRRLIINSNLNEPQTERALESIGFLLENIEHHNTRDLIFKHLNPFYENVRDNELIINDLEFPKLLNSLDFLMHIIKGAMFDRNNSVNSAEYYSKKINELEAREAELRESLNFNQTETEEQRKLAEETKEKLRVIETELNKKKQELELKQKQEDAKNDWEQKINETFDNLKEYLKPIETEHKRLNILYYVYAALCVLTLLLIIGCEITLLYKIGDSEGFPKINEYLTVLLPLPIAGALMWGFIFQMNRAQRQLISISNNIHSIKYIQGLLLSINNLSIDVNDGITRVNSALDKIISNHLNIKVITDEVELISEEEKDKIDLDSMLRIITAMKK